MALEKSDLIAIYESMNQYADKMHNENEIGLKIAKKTNLFIRVVIILFIIGSAFIFYKSSGLSESMKHLASSIVEMYVHFGEMTENVNAMNNSVREMNQYIKGMPSLSNDVVILKDSITIIKKNIAVIDNDVKQIEFKMNNITGQVHIISQHFIRINGSVSHMQSNTRQMAQPLRSLKQTLPFMP